MKKNGFYLLSAPVPGTGLVSWTECSQFSERVRDVQMYKDKLLTPLGYSQ